MEAGSDECPSSTPPSPQSSAKGRLIATEWAIRLVTDVQRRCGLEGSYIPPGRRSRGAFMEPFMTTSLMRTVSGLRAPQSSQSETNEQEPQQRG